MAYKDDIIAELRAVVDDLKRENRAQAIRIAELELKNWIWCITAPLFTLFHIATSRSRSVLEELIGTDYKGFIHFD